MTKFAAGTKVSPETSRAEIERLLRRYKATGFAYASTSDGGAVMFEIAGRRVRFVMRYPDRSSFVTDGRGRLRTAAAINNVVDQAHRQLWRALALVIKAKLEAVDAKITTIEEEFMAHIVLPNGRTVGDEIRPKIADAYRSGHMPSLLLGGPGQ